MPCPGSSTAARSWARAFVPSLVGLAVLVGVGGGREAFGHGGAVPPAPPPPPTPPWLKQDPFVPRPTAPKPGVRPVTPPPVLPAPPPGVPTTPGERVKPSGLGPGGSGPGGPPTKPPPPPKSGTPGLTPSTPTNPAPAPSAPASPGMGRPAASNAARRGATAHATDWTDWWDVNADSLRARDTVVRRALTGAGGDDALALESARDRTILPFLREVLAGRKGHDEDLLASASLALGKTADDPADVARLRELLARDTTPRMARESAALALGLLRRSTPLERFDGAVLDEVRQCLFDAMDDDAVHVRARCFAAFALGLLGDQPHRAEDAFAKDGRLVVRGLWARLHEERTGPEATVAILVALGLQPQAGVPQAVKDGLRAFASTGRLKGRQRGSVAQAHAALALARLGGEEALGSFLALVKGSSHEPHLRRSAVTALGLLAPRLDAVRRQAAIAVLLDQSQRGDPETAGLAWISTARLLVADVLTDRGTVARRSQAHEAMLDALRHATTPVRPWAALAMGLVLRSVDAPAETDGDGKTPWRDRALAALRAEAEDEGSDPAARGAYVLALGLARDLASMPLLGRTATGSGTTEELRAHACAAIGLLGRATPEALGALRTAMAVRTSDEIRREAARALGTLGDVEVLDRLLAELKSSSADHVRARAALALGEIRASGSVLPLVKIADDRAAGDLARAIAVAALGLVGDPEPMRSLALLGADANYLARTDALTEALSLL